MASRRLAILMCALSLFAGGIARAQTIYNRQTGAKQASSLTAGQVVRATDTNNAGLAAPSDDVVMVGNGSTWQDKSLTDCDDTGGNHLNYDTATNAFSCGTSGGGGSGDITDVWACTTGNCNALTGAAGDSLDAGSADSISPAVRSTTLPGTCTEGNTYQDTDSGGTEWYVCTAPNTWTKTLAGIDINTSAELRALVTDETGSSGALVFAGSPSLTTPTIADFTNAMHGHQTAAGGGQLDINAATVGNYVATITAGAGISGSSGVHAGAPTISWAPATQSNSVTLWDGVNATRTLTADLSGTDPVITFGSSAVDVTTGTLKQGGTAVSLAGHTHAAGDLTSGTLALARGGTNQGSWTANRCVRVNAGGTALEAATADCATGGVVTGLTADSGGTTTGAIVTLDGGAGVDTSRAGDTITFIVDKTEIGTGTWGSGSAITWTFDASAGIDTTLTFGNGTITVGADMPVTGQIQASSLGIDFSESDVNPSCGGGVYNLYADTSETKLKQCRNGSVLDVGDVSNSRSIGTTAPLSGGGDLSANRTLSITANGIGPALIDETAAYTWSNTHSFASGTLVLPTAAGLCSLATAQGQACWDSTAKLLSVGDGTTALTFGGDVTAVGNCTSGACFVDGTNNGSALTYEGATINANQTTLTFTGDPSGAFTVTIPNVTGTLVTTGDTGTVTSTMLTNGTIVPADVDLTQTYAWTAPHSWTAVSTATSGAVNFLSTAPSIAPSGATTADWIGGQFFLDATGPYALNAGATVTGLYAYSTSSVSADSTNAAIYGAFLAATKSGTGAIGTLYGLKVLVGNANTGAVTNAYGVYISDSVTANTITNDYALYTAGAEASRFGGPVGIGTAAAPASGYELDVYDGSAEALARIQSAGTNTDARLELTTASESWDVYVDESDAQRFKIQSDDANQLFALQTDGRAVFQATNSAGSGFVRQLYANLTFSPSSSSTAFVYGINGAITNAGAGQALYLAGIEGSTLSTGSGGAASAYGVRATTTKNGTGAITDAYGVYGAAVNQNATNSVTNAYGIYGFVNASVASATITNGYGVYIANSNTTGTITNDWALYGAGAEKSRLGGSLGVGGDPTARLDVQATASGDEVSRLSTATTGADPRYSVYEYRGTTSGAASTTFDLPTTSDRTYLMEVWVGALCTNAGGGCTTGQAGGWISRAVYKNVAGTLTEVNETNDYAQDDITGTIATPDVSVSGTNVRLTVTGLANQTDTWHVVWKLQEIGA